MCVCTCHKKEIDQLKKELQAAKYQVMEVKSQWLDDINKRDLAAEKTKVHVPFLSHSQDKGICLLNKRIARESKTNV